LKKFISASILVACIVFQIGNTFAETQCESNIKVPRAENNTVLTDAATTVRMLTPSFFGFNMEWLEFQLGLWDTTNQRVLPSVVSIFKEFPGAVYRFPGGTNSNHIDWRDAVGPVATRQPRKHVRWSGPLRAEFGLDEYLRFVKDVDGQAWYVANLYGALDSVKSPAELARNAERIATYTLERARKGMPPILRWELGNELDRGALKWSPDRVADVALQVAAALKRSDPAAKFVTFQQEYPAQADKGYSAARYNKELRDAVTTLRPDFAMHFYYDGPPDVPPVDYFLKQLCQVIDNAKAEGSKGHVWITESGRVPNGFWKKTPKELWPETANLTAAISLADMMIALTQIPEVRGAFTHSLVTTTSPWPLVHKRSNGVIDPSVTLLGLKLLRQNMLANVLASIQTSGDSGWQGANYAVRSAVLTNNERTAFTLWTINKSNKQQKLQFEIKNAKLAIDFTDASTITDQQVNANNYVTSTRVQIKNKAVTVISNGASHWSIQLPPNSVNALKFTSQY
jgi:alpha-N-arabinofuranosidase